MDCPPKPRCNRKGVKVGRSVDLRKGFGATRRRLRSAWEWDDFQNVSYSQEGEDLILTRLFGGQERGFYVDIGAHHPRRFSNTYWASRRGWRGLNVDASKDAIDQLENERPNDTNVQACVAAASGDMTFFHFAEPALNTASRERAEYIYESTGMAAHETVVPAMPVASLLGKYLPQPRPIIDLLTIDIEGSERVALESNDWDSFRPRVVVVELLGAIAETAPQTQGAQLLREQGYDLVSFLYHSAIFVCDETLLRRHWGGR